MPSGLIALLDDVAAIAKIAAASIDDIGVAVGKAGTKAAGVVIDDTAVTPRYVTGFTPERELPIIGKIALGSLKNKLFILLPVAMLLVAFAPFLVTPLLMIGGAYLAFEATEKIIEKILARPSSIEESCSRLTRPKSWKSARSRARSAPISSCRPRSWPSRWPSSPAIRSGCRPPRLSPSPWSSPSRVYGVVALIVKLDDIGLHLAERSSASARALGRGLVHIVPSLLTGLSAIGTAAMLWVGGGILVHGLEELHCLEGVAAYRP